MKCRVLIEARFVDWAKHNLELNNVEYTCQDLYDYFDDSLNTQAFFIEDVAQAMRLSMKFRAPFKIMPTL